MGLVGQAIMGSAGDLATGLPPRREISRVCSAAKIECLPQSKLDVCPNAFASMEERSGIAQYLIRPSPRYRMTQTTMTEPKTSCRKVGFPLSFPQLPTNPRSHPVHPRRPPGPGNEGVPHTPSLQPSLHRHKWHHVVGMANDAENIIDLYDRNAKAWDRERPRKLLERAWLERFLSLVALGGSVLDIGCGTAEPIARFFIERCYEPGRRPP